MPSVNPAIRLVDGECAVTRRCRVDDMEFITSIECRSMNEK
jgi:hypothetical protein